MQLLGMLLIIQGFIKPQIGSVVFVRLPHECIVGQPLPRLALGYFSFKKILYFIIRKWCSQVK